MSERQIENSMGAWVRAVPVPTGVRSIAVVGAWLALTGLFMFGSIVLLGTVVTALESLPLVSSLTALVGVLAACGVAPTFASVIVGTAVERCEAIFGRDSAEESDVPGRCDTKRQAYCQPSRECCC